MNLLKRYPDLLEILHLNDIERKKSLMGVYKRDIEDNPDFRFRGKQIYPVKSDGVVDMGRQFTHLTCEEVEEEDESGRIFVKRIFEKDRSQRLHWIRHHVEEHIPASIEVFSIKERDSRKREDVYRTYIYDVLHKYIIVLEVQRNTGSYYLLTAYYLNRDYAEKGLKKKMKKRLSEVL